MPPADPGESGETTSSITPTICDLMSIPRPALCGCEPLAGVMRACRKAGITAVERCLLYAPDAVGTHIFDRQPGLLEEVRRSAPIVEPLRSVFPPKTPVCFASMLTGAAPTDHGITAYERPVLKCDTIFDALVRAGRRPAIVSVKDASVDLIFRGRDMEYLSEPGDREVTARVLELLLEGRHHFILAYHQEYDDLLHEGDPYDRRAIDAVRRHVLAFKRMADMARECWGGRPGLVVFAPDHGAHVDSETGRGVHGDDIPDDMEVLHFFGLTA